MKRTLSIAAAVVALLALFAGLSLAADTLGGNARKGKYLYRKNCRSCHGVNASDLSPSSKTQAEWKKLYDGMAALPCHDKWPTDMGAEDYKDIFSYLYDYAKDSPSPAKCS